MRIGQALLAAVALSSFATGCTASSEARGTLRIVASTDVYGDIAHQVAGGHAQITAFIDDPAQDPHSFEASARNQLAISRADVLIENGGGYDDFVDRMRGASGRSATVVLNAVAISGRRAAGGELNEHVWYDLPSMVRLADRLATALAAKDPADRATYRANAARFATGVAQLERTEAGIRTAHHGEGVAITEPVPLYLLDACGLVDRTPPSFSAAIEAGTDVSASVLRRTLALFRAQQVQALVYNAQTSGPETAKVVAAARASGVPVVPVTETLPAGTDYLAWMAANLAAVAAAVNA